MYLNKQETICECLIIDSFHVSLNIADFVVDGIGCVGKEVQAEGRAGTMFRAAHQNLT